MRIRHTRPEDMPQLMELFESARLFMRQTGNLNQWTNGYPDEAQIRRDMEAGGSYVCEENGQIVGTFFFIVGEEPTYRTIYDGQWPNNDVYAVVHRIAAARGTKGVGSFCLGWCYDQHPNIRIDTHRDNIPMQRLLAKNGYSRCGIIYLENGDERIAFAR